MKLSENWYVDAPWAQLLCSTKLPDDKVQKFIEVTDEDQIRQVLNQFIGLTEGKAVYFEIEDQKIYAEFETGREESNKISSVHYIQFNFNATAKAAFLDNPQSVKLIINYKNYTYSETINEGMHKSWSEDLVSS